MGYTHYFTFNKPKGVKAATLEQTYQSALKECAKLARAYNAACTKAGLTDNRLSGYTAHSKLGQYGGLQINGKADLAHESFELREHFSENGAGFCKTAMKPYDVVVVACLAILKYRLGDAISVGSDGSGEDWDRGVALARRVIRRKVPNPIEYKQVLRLVK